MNFWEVLGLAPGQDAATIKKAYATKLRVTRPDDDAIAYQQLREAYDAALAHVKRMPRAASSPMQWKVPPMPSDEAMAVNAPPDKQKERDAPKEPQGPQGPQEPEQPEQTQEPNQSEKTKETDASAPATLTWPNATAQPLPAGIDVDDLVSKTLDLWEKQGDAALLAYWPQLQNILHDSALTQALACSTAFARMVLGQSQLSPEFVDQLRFFFGWGTDYKRTPELTGPEAIQFKRRLAQVTEQLARGEQQSAQRLAQQMRQKELKEEQDRIKAAKAAEMEAKAAQAKAKAAAAKAKAAEIKARAVEIEVAALKRLADVTRARFGHLLHFARLIVTASRQTGITYAMMKGPVLQEQWSGLAQVQRELLEIDDACFHVGIDTCKEAMHQRSLLGLLIMPVGFWLLAAERSFGGYFFPVLVGLLLCHQLPLYQWQERMRQRLYPCAFLEKWIRADVIAPRLSRKYCIFFSALGVILCLGLAAPLMSHAYRYTAGAALIAVVLLACQWLFPPDGREDNPGVVIPVLIFCLGACNAAGITDILTLLSLGAYWFAVAYSALSKNWSRSVGLVWVLTLVVISFYWRELAPQSHGWELIFVPLSFVAPLVLFLLARRQTARFVMSTIALGVLSQPFADPAMLGFWVGAVAVMAGCGAALMRRLADRLA